MPNLMETSLAYGLKEMKARAGTVSYQRGANSVTVSAGIGRTEFEQVDESGIVTKFESRDYLVLTADLVLAGAATLPQRGDRIVETQGSKTYTYEVMSAGDEPHWRYADGHRKQLRIHTKQVVIA